MLPGWVLAEGIPSLGQYGVAGIILAVALPAFAVAARMVYKDMKDQRDYLQKLLQEQAAEMRTTVIPALHASAVAQDQGAGAVKELTQVMRDALDRLRELEIRLRDR